MEQKWMVLLEATADSAGPPLGTDTLRAFMASMGRAGIEGLHNPYRFAIQLRLASSSPAEAMFSAVARWADATGRLGLDGWALQRAELVTPAEFELDAAAARIG